MFDHDQKYHGGDRAILVALETRNSVDSDLVEFEELVRAADVEAVQILTGRVDSPNQRYYMGSGKAEEVKAAAALHEANVVIVNQELSPSQNRNLERLLACRVVDRTALILDIFAQRAQSFEGKLQVELAQLTHISTRLVRMWTHLERQRGGSVGLRGPGETQLESDRRMIGNRIKQLKKRLEKVQQTRAQSRALRKRTHIPAIALVGYTNAGKSSLFNRLTEAEAYVEDLLFATLDPQHRRIDLKNIGRAVLIDTVGFISKLPHELVAAFQSTLQSAAEADLLLEVIDVVDPERIYKHTEVVSVLDEIGAAEVHRIQVFNKIDLSDKIEPHVVRNDEGVVTGVWLSAQKDIGITLLYEAIAEYFHSAHVRTVVTIPPEGAKLRAQLFELDVITEEHIDEQGKFILSLHMAKQEWARLIKTNVLAKKYFDPTILGGQAEKNW